MWISVSLLLLESKQQWLRALSLRLKDTREKHFRDVGFPQYAARSPAALFQIEFGLCKEHDIIFDPLLRYVV